LKYKIEKKNNFNKRKKIRITRIKLVKIMWHKFGFNDEIERKIKTFIKEPRKKLKIKRLRIGLKTIL